MSDVVVCQRSELIPKMSKKEYLAHQTRYLESDLVLSVKFLDRSDLSPLESQMYIQTLLNRQQKKCPHCNEPVSKYLWIAHQSVFHARRAKIDLAEHKYWREHSTGIDENNIPTALKEHRGRYITDFDGNFIKIEYTKY